MSRKLDAILIPNHFINKVSIRYTRSEFDGTVPSYNINPNITRWLIFVIVIISVELLLDIDLPYKPNYLS